VFKAFVSEGSTTGSLWVGSWGQRAPPSTSSSLQVKLQSSGNHLPSSLRGWGTCF